MSQATRREVLVTIAALGMAAAPVEAQAGFLSGAELKWVAALVDAIIPRTDTPGASDVGVPAFIELRLSGNAALAARFREGMTALEAAAKQKLEKGFVELSESEKVTLLTSMEQEPFVQLVKNMTVDGYYSSKAGLTQELGWHGNTFVAKFDGCTHPEHQS